MKKRYNNNTFLSAFLLLLLFAVSSCGGDDPTSGLEGDPPEFPAFEELEPDLSYFQNNNPKMQAANNFYEGKSYALGLAAFSSLGQMYFNFFYATDESEAEFKNGKWTWEYSYGFEGQSVSIVLTSQELSDSYRWEMNWSFDDGQGNSFEDYTMIEGTVAKDGSSGSWTFNSMNPDTNQEVPILVTNWTRTGEDSYELITQFNYEGETSSETYTFTQNGSEFDIEYTGGSENIIIHWNTDTGTGYYQIGNDISNRSCWDSQFQDVSCGA